MGGSSGRVLGVVGIGGMFEGGTGKDSAKIDIGEASGVVLPYRSLEYSSRSVSRLSEGNTETC